MLPYIRSDHGHILVQVYLRDDVTRCACASGSMKSSWGSLAPFSTCHVWAVVPAFQLGPSGSGLRDHSSLGLFTGSGLRDHSSFGLWTPWIHWCPSGTIASLVRCSFPSLRGSRAGQRLQLIVHRPSGIVCFTVVETHTSVVRWGSVG